MRVYPGISEGREGVEGTLKLSLARSTHLLSGNLVPFKDEYMNNHMVPHHPEKNCVGALCVLNSFS